MTCLPTVCLSSGDTGLCLTDAGTIAAAVLAPICFLLLGGALGAWGWHRYSFP